MITTKQIVDYCNANNLSLVDHVDLKSYEEKDFMKEVERWRDNEWLADIIEQGACVTLDSVISPDLRALVTGIPI